MPMHAASTTGEGQQLLAQLAQQRDALRHACFGLTEDEARATPTASVLSVGGLLKHATYAEGGWVERLGGPPASDAASWEDAYGTYLASFSLGDGETVAGALADSERQQEETAAAFAAEDDLERLVPLPPVPWLPAGGGVTVRWIALHVVAELARHAGHADILRECIDGAGSGPLMAAVEGWPADGWITPWVREG